MQGVPPLLLLDVDGVLNAFAAATPEAPARAGGYRDFRDDAVAGELGTVWVRWSPAMAADLARLPVEIRWLTSWAAESARPRLRRLEVLLGWEPLRLPDAVDPPVGPDFTGWKVRVVDRLLAAAGDRPVAWVEDEAVAVARQGSDRLPDLVVETDPATGLRPDEVAVIRRWAERFDSPKPPSYGVT